MYWRRVSAILAIFSSLSFATTTSALAITLTYDNSVINLFAGQSATIGATLVAPGWQTDEWGNRITQPPLGIPDLIYVKQVISIESYILGSPEQIFQMNTTFTISTPNPVGNLDVVNSVHLDLGELQTQDSLPVG